MKEAHVVADRVMNGVRKGTHSFEDAEAALEHLWRAKAELRWPDGYPPDVIRHQVEGQMKELRRAIRSITGRQPKESRVSSPESRAKAAAKAKDRDAKAVAKAKERKARADAKVKERKARAEAKLRERKAKADAKVRERQAKVEAKAREREAMNKLEAVEVGALRGTHTLRQLEAAATKVFTLQFASRKPASPRGTALSFRLGRLKTDIAAREMKEIGRGLMDGTHTLEEAEAATINFHRALAAAKGRTLDETKLRAMAERELSQLKRAAELRRRSEAPEERRWRMEFEQTEEMLKTLTARAGDERLAPAERAEAKRRLAETEVYAAEIKHRSAVRDAERIALRVLKGSDPVAAAEAAFRAEAEARGKLEQVWPKHELEQARRQLNSLIKVRVNEVRRRIAAKEQRKRNEERKVIERERAQQERKLRADKARQAQKLRAEKERQERKVRAEKERKERPLRAERERKEQLRQQVAQERRRQQEQKAAESIVLVEAARVKKTGQDEICEYRFIVTENGETATLSNVCIDQNGNVSHSASKGLHPFTVGLLAMWSLIPLPPAKQGRAALEELRQGLSSPERGHGYFQAVLRHLSGNYRRVPSVHSYVDVLGMMLSTSGGALAGGQERIKLELLSALNGMLEAFEKPPLPSALIA